MKSEVSQPPCQVEGGQFYKVSQTRGQTQSCPHGEEPLRPAPTRRNQRPRAEAISGGQCSGDFPVTASPHLALSHPSYPFFQKIQVGRTHSLIQSFTQESLSTACDRSSGLKRRELIWEIMPSGAGSVPQGGTEEIMGLKAGVTLSCQQ